MEGTSFPAQADHLGIPLPVLLTARQLDEVIRLTYHHHVFPSTAPEVLTPHGSTVRKTYGQLLSRGIHDRCHNLIGLPDLEQLCGTEQIAFEKSVLLTSGYMPDEAIDLYARGGPKRVHMSPDQRKVVKRSMCIEDAYKARSSYHRRAEIGVFFASHVLRRPVDHVSDSIKDELLHTPNPSRRIELGNFYIKEAIQVETSPIKPLFTELKQQGAIPEKAPVTPAGVVVSFFTKRRFANYTDHIIQTLQAA